MEVITQWEYKSKDIMKSEKGKKQDMVEHKQIKPSAFNLNPKGHIPKTIKQSPHPKQLIVTNMILLYLCPCLSKCGGTNGHSCSATASQLFEI
uniref:Uncharacterized protein n=1 Tax=Arundo donax TaxID=35708 RepID=A0A0A8XYT3_ARUDO